MGLTEGQTCNQTRIWVDIPLINDVKTDNPETQGMTYTGVADWALRKQLKKRRA